MLVVNSVYRRSVCAGCQLSGQLFCWCWLSAQCTVVLFVLVVNSVYSCSDCAGCQLSAQLFCLCWLSTQCTVVLLVLVVFLKTFFFFLVCSLCCSCSLKCENAVCVTLWVIVQSVFFPTKRTAELVLKCRRKTTVFVICWKAIRIRAFNLKDRQKKLNYSPYESEQRVLLLICWQFLPVSCQKNL